MVPSEEVILSMTRHGYIKRTSIRSFNASGVEDIGLKDGDSLLKRREDKYARYRTSIYK